MIRWLKVLVFCTVLQILVSVGAITYLQVHSSDMAREYSLLAETNARAFTSASVLDLYNKIQREMQINRIQTTNEIKRAIELNNARRDSKLSPQEK
jgi:hypothetical protein